MKNLLQSLFFFLLTTQICFGQWVQVGLNDKSIKDIAIKDATIFAVTEDNELYRSTNNGANYTMIVDSTFNVAISQTGKVFISKDGYNMGQNIFTSSDNGANWMLVNIVEQIQDSLYVQFFGFTKITVSSTGIIFCTLRVGIWWEQWGSHLISKSNDDGLTWTTTGIGIIGGNLFDFRNQSCITIGFKHQAYVFPDHFIHLTSDNGNTWNYLGRMPVPPPFINSEPNVLGLFSSGNILVGGTITDSTGLDHPRIFLSTDMCSTWTQVSTLNCQVGLSVSDGSTEGMLVGTDSLGVFLFSDEGDSLGSRSDGLTNLNIQTLTLDNNGYVYAGTENGVWRRPLSEIVTSVDDEPTQPTAFILEQNYPNPFNPSTTFRYSIPTQSKVVIKVFDILGNEIATLMDEEKSVGNYELTWDAANLSSGVYFYQLKAGEFLQTRKMILLK